MRFAELNYMFFFFFNDTATTEIYTLSLHDALPIYFRTCSSDIRAVQSSSLKSNTLRAAGLAVCKDPSWQLPQFFWTIARTALVSLSAGASQPSAFAPKHAAVTIWIQPTITQAPSVLIGNLPRYERSTAAS